MKNYIIIGIVLLLLSTTLVSSKILENEESFYKNINISEIKSDEIVLFEDDFDDNIKDMNKWTEIFTDGIWEETNQRCEFMMYEPGGDRIYEGIESTEFIAPVNPSSPLIINWMIQTDIGSTNWAGRVSLEITDGENWLWARYHRYLFETQFKDSNDDIYTVLGNKPEGQMSCEIQIFSDRYIVIMDEDSSGEVFNSLFSPGAPLSIRLYIDCSGDQPWLYQKSSFDDILISYQEPVTSRALIFGRINNLKEFETFNVFETVNTRLLTFNPISFNKYTDGEAMVVFGDKIGLLSNNFALGIFNVAI